MILGRVCYHGGLLHVARSDGLASVIDAGSGQLTYVFSQDMDNAQYIALTTTTERATAHERGERTKSEYSTLTQDSNGEPIDAPIDLGIF